MRSAVSPGASVGTGSDGTPRQPTAVTEETAAVTAPQPTIAELEARVSRRETDEQ